MDLKTFCEDNEIYGYLLDEWNYEENECLPDNIGKGSNKKANWKCRKNNKHKWDDSVSHRTSGRGCPYCAGKRVLKGDNDLASNVPEIAKYWDYEKNKQTPEEITCNSGRKFFWKCEKGHSWERSVAAMRKAQGTCPICTGQKVLKGYNDFPTTHPKIFEEWDFTKNTIDPHEISIGIRNKCYWKCKYGHSWKAWIYSRSHTGCPKCAKNIKKSQPELYLYFNLKEVFPGAISGEELERKEIDIFIPELNLAIEYDGCRWHMEDNQQKKKKILKRGMKYIIINEVIKTEKIIEVTNETYKGEDDGKVIEGDFTRIKYKLQNDFKNLGLVFQEILKVGDVDINKYGFEKDRFREAVNEATIFLPKDSLANKYPEIAEEWDYEKNKDLIPELITASSNKIVHWRCKNKGHHKWKSTPGNRIAGRGCPYCGNKKIIVGENDLATTHPEIAKYWDYDKNTSKPTEVTFGSSKIVFWKCNEGHSYKRKVAMQCTNDSCPVCGGTVVVAGVNDLMTTHPEIAKYWNYEKNKNVDIKAISFGSGKNVWWNCENGENHSYLAKVTNRIRSLSGCSVCINRSIVIGVNDLATTHPKLAEEFDEVKNLPLRVIDIVKGTQKKVHWICNKCGKSFIAMPMSRGIEGGCKECHTVERGRNDLVTTHPEMAREFNVDKNYPMTAYDISKGSGKKVWWKCSCGEEWEAKPNDRVSVNCAICNNRKLKQGVNDLLTKYPKVAQYWDYEKNIIKPSEVTCGSSKVISWKCDKGHSYNRAIRTRVKTEQCPVCSCSIVIEGVNDISTTHSEIAKYWDFEKNRGIDIKTISAKSKEKVAWICEEGKDHSYVAKVSSRVNNTNGCFVCRNIIVVPGVNDLATTHPILAEEFDEVKNSPLRATEIVKGSQKEIYWICNKCGKSFSALPSWRGTEGGCRECYSKNGK